MAERERALAPERIFWTRGVSLTSRILAVNIIALGLIAGSLFYLDSYRNRLLAERFGLARAEVEIIARSLRYASRIEQRAMMASIGTEQQLRLRLFDRQGRQIADSFELASPSYALVDPGTEPWYQHAARALDRGMDFVLGTPPVPAFREPAIRSAQSWPEVMQARSGDVTAIRQRIAPDRTPVITAATQFGKQGTVLLTTRNATDITQNVRDARQTLAIIVGTALIVSVLLSLFLARTIVQPLRALVRAAVRVRLGRDRAVVVPRLPERRDEIGMLARAISDMTAALRQRIDSVETFAADVAHEIKNPLASLRSALESLEKVEDPQLRRELGAIAAHDVRRIDRLVTEIADASRIDAELSRTTFEVVDMARLVAALVAAREVRGVNRDCRVHIERQDPSPMLVSGDPPRLERVMENLLDNAVSFSPDDGAITVAFLGSPDRVEISVIDDGPGIPEEARDQIFERFHSLRPADEDFGSHSGLGLAIARTIIEAHDGSLTAHNRRDGRDGARLCIDLPRAEDPA